MQTATFTLGSALYLALCVVLVTPACGDPYQALDTREALGRTFTGAALPPALGEANHREACGLAQCEVGEHCCFSTGECLQTDALDELCRTPLAFEVADGTIARAGLGSIDDYQPGEGDPCASNADCVEGQFCDAPLCLGEGVCRSRDDRSCDEARYDEHLDAEFADDPVYKKYLQESMQVCGCDGFNYDSEYQAWRRGVRVASAASTLPCGGLPTPPEAKPGEPAYATFSIDAFNGTDPCPSDGNCSVGAICCEVTRTCMLDAAHCFMPPAVGYPCLSDDECSSDDHYNYYCERPDCGTHGYCREPEPWSNDCNALAPVCGCDAVSYLNPCAAHEAHQSVAHEGECETP